LTKLQILNLLGALAVSCAGLALPRQAPVATVDSVLHAYVQALGGEAALNRIADRQIEAKIHHAGKVIYFWAKPNKVVRVAHGEKVGFDGSSSWMLSRKKKLTKLPKAEQWELETNANPVRFAHLRDLYADVEPAAAERLDDRPMNVLVAPNNIGSTKFYFDTSSHLLVRIEEFGVTSAYYKQVTEFLDYKTADGIQFPFRIVHSTTEPGMKGKELRIASLDQNVGLKPEFFTKPQLGAVTLGGKR
jgi:hypothetical protein